LLILTSIIAIESQFSSTLAPAPDLSGSANANDMPAVKS